MLYSTWRSWVVLCGVSDGLGFGVLFTRQGFCLHAKCWNPISNVQQLSVCVCVCVSSLQVVAVPMRASRVDLETYLSFSKQQTFTASSRELGNHYGQNLSPTSSIAMP